MRVKRSQRLETLAQRRMVLTVRAQLQREELGMLCDQLETKARPVELAWKLFRKVREHPILVSVATAVLTKLLLRRSGLWQRISSIPGRLSILWQLWKRGRQVWAQYREYSR